MNPFVRKRIFAILMVCVLLFNTCAALAESVLVQNDTRVYASANTSAASAKVEEGTLLTLVSEKNGWAKVQLDGNTGYMKSEDVAKIQSYNGKAAYTTEKTEVYKTWSTESKHLGTIPANAEVAVGAIAGKWALVRYENMTGYVLLETMSPNAPKTEEKDSGVQTVNFTAYAAVENAKVYNSSGKVLGNVPLNTSVTVKAIKNGICMVQRQGVTAYMMQSELSASKIEVKQEETKKEETKKDDGVTWISATTYYVQKDNAKVYNTSGKVIGQLPLNTSVSVTAYNDMLALVSKSGNTGFMYRTDLALQKVEVKQEETKKDDGVTWITPTTYYVQKDGAAVYNTSGETVSTLNVNTELTVTAYNDSYALVSNGSATGLMLRSDLGTSKVTVALQKGDSGDAVKQLQERLQELGYFGGTVGGNYGDITVAAVKNFQSVAGLEADGVAGVNTLKKLFSDDVPKKPVPTTPTNGSSATPATGTAVEADWWTSDISKIFARGTEATITDVSTGIAWKETRTGGTNHADVQPSTAADTAAMKKAVGSWSWTRRAIFVTIDGVNYAASMNAMPHGSGSTIPDNNFNGHHCIHFTNSRTHGTNKVCALHQAAIKKALNATL